MPACTGRSGGSYGGRIQIAADLMTLDGALRANGNDGWYRLAGGSGGSVVLGAGVLSGSGAIQANGGVNGSESGAGGGGMAVTVNGLDGWRYTLERRESLTEGEWLPVPGQTEILCETGGPLVLTDATVLPQAFYRVVSEP
ncbi:MAG: hypothetical protein PHU80_10955 [Kiritimatiellae bacterium]|nr:hypothetical protein [Kiritimatiellia bacterium]